MRRALMMGAAGAASAAGLLAARQRAYAPADRDLAERAEAAQYSGPWTHGFADVNGVRLHYAEIGSGPLVILLHGFPQCWYQWRHVMTRLSTEFHLVAPDMRGYNWSTKPDGVSAYHPREIAQDIIALIATFGQTRAHVVGHDWGGAIAWQIGIDHPEHVNRLAVINAPHPGAYARKLLSVDQILRSLYVFFFQLPLLPEAVVRSTIRASLRNSASIPGSFTEEALDVYEDAMARPGAATATLNYYRAVGRSAFGWLKEGSESRIELPTLLIWGMQDFALSPRLTEGLDPWLPNLQILRVHDSNHWVPEEKPGVVAEALRAFLSA